MAIIDNSLFGQYEANLKAQTNTDRVATDKNTFLKLLVAQLTHQDPLNPVEDKEFVAQLAQFTTVEELQGINKGMQDLNGSYLRQQASNAVGFIGMQISAKGDNVSISNIGSTDPSKSPSSSWIYLTFPAKTADGMFNVYATNPDGSIGRLVYSNKMGPQAEGTRGFQWEGRDGSGNPLPDGTYIVNVTAVDDEGNNLIVTSSSIGTVVGVETATDGNHKLMLSDGRNVRFNDVEIITDPQYLNKGTNTADQDEKQASSDTEGATSNDNENAAAGEKSAESGNSAGNDGDKTTDAANGGETNAASGESAADKGAENSAAEGNAADSGEKNGEAG